ncbi:Uncharacterised protein [uncultured archaeon]|nr:Uncharacterised protein [uncultured archaeon]
MFLFQTTATVKSTAPAGIDATVWSTIAALKKDDVVLYTIKTKDGAIEQHIGKYIGFTGNVNDKITIQINAGGTISPATDYNVSGIQKIEKLSAGDYLFIKSGKVTIPVTFKELDLRGLLEDHLVVKTPGSMGVLKEYDADLMDAGITVTKTTKAAYDAYVTKLTEAFFKKTATTTKSTTVTPADAEFSSEVDKDKLVAAIKTYAKGKGATVNETALKAEIEKIWGTLSTNGSYYVMTVGDVDIKIKNQKKEGSTNAAERQLNAYVIPSSTTKTDTPRVKPKPIQFTNPKSQGDTNDAGIQVKE